MAIQHFLLIVISGDKGISQKKYINTVNVAHFLTFHESQCLTVLIISFSCYQYCCRHAVLVHLKFLRFG